jgi:hypothetical protein
MLDLAHLVKSESEPYLQRAISEYSDSYYGNGVSVGATARLMLAQLYIRLHREQEAVLLIKEIRSKYPDAVANDGGPLSSQLPSLPTPIW